MWDYTKESIRKIYWNTSPLKTQLEILNLSPLKNNKEKIDGLTNLK